jgi:hypothetical protein
VGKDLGVKRSLKNFPFEEISERRNQNAQRL